MMDVELFDEDELLIINADNLIYPADKGRDLNVDSRYIRTCTTKAPGYETGDFIVTICFTD